MILSSVNWNVFFVKADEFIIQPTTDLQDSDTMQHEIVENKYLDPSLVPIDHEVIDKRTQYEKLFRKTDGTYEVAIYGEPVHFMDNGKWNDIDNRLLDNGNELETKDNKFKVKFPKTIDDSKTLKLTMDSYSIDWNVLNINKSNVYYDDTEKISNNIKELTNINQSVIYNNIQSNVDLEYIISGSKVKENIVLNQYISNYSISFEYKLKDLEIITDEDGNVVFVNEKMKLFSLLVIYT